MLALLMDGQKAQLYATDPPYGVGYDGTSHPRIPGIGTAAARPAARTGTGAATITTTTRGTTSRTGSSSRGSWSGCSSAPSPTTDLDAAWYCWHASATAASFLRAWEITSIRYHQTITWVKPTHVLGFAMWNYRTEPCLMGWQQGHKPAALPVPDEHSNCWEVDWEGKARCTDGQHPDPEADPPSSSPMLSAPARAPSAWRRSRAPAPR